MHAHLAHSFERVSINVLREVQDAENCILLINVFD